MAPLDGTGLFGSTGGPYIGRRIERCVRLYIDVHLSNGTIDPTT